MPGKFRLYPRLSAYYFFHFGALGALMPYWGPYLKSLGYDERRIGIVFAVLLGTKIVAPNVWGWLADRAGRRMPVIRAGALCAALIYALLLVEQSYAAILLVMAGFGFFWNAILPQFEATTLNHLGSEHQRYSLIRLWGSVGFIVAVTGIGWYLDTQPIANLPFFVLAFLVGIVFVTLAVPEGGMSRTKGEDHSVRRVLFDSRVAGLFLVFFLMQVSHGPYYGFFSLFLEENGYAASRIGQLWAVGVAAEVGIFLLMPRLLQGFSAKTLLMFSLAAATVRWLMIATFVDKIGVILLAQTLHLASFGIYHAIAVHYVHRFFTGRLQGRGQALYSSLGFGAGGAVGSLVAGFVWDAFSPADIFLVAALMTALALLIASRSVDEIPQSQEYKQIFKDSSQ